MILTTHEQAECLRRYGYEREAALVESGQVTIPPDALAGTWACLQLADALRALSDSYSRPHWKVTARERGSVTTISVQADSELQAAFLAGTRLGRGCELVSVDAESSPRTGRR